MRIEIQANDGRRRIIALISVWRGLEGLLGEILKTRKLLGDDNTPYLRANSNRSIEAARIAGIEIAATIN